jgi:parallel beta-helix repeat protein
MTHQGFNIPQSKNFHICALPVGLSALLAVTGGFILQNKEVNAGELPQKVNASLTTAQAPVGATTLYVNPETGQDSPDAGTSEAKAYKTITYALKQAIAGTVIQLAPGTYNQESGEVFPLTVGSGVTLRGDESTKGQGILIVGSGNFISPTFARQNVAILAQKDSAISGITVTNPENRGTGVWIETANVLVSNSTFTNSVREGVFVTGKANPKIENNVFIQNKGNGVSVAKSAQGEVRSNLFQDTGFGVAVSDLASPLIADNQILQNNGGIVVNGSSKPVLRNNVIQDNRDHGLVVIQNAQPDLGTAENPGKNLIRNNGKKDVKKFFDVMNATAGNTILAVGNDIDEKRISGKVDFVAAAVDAPSGATAFRDVPAGYWAKTYIEALAAKNIIAGFPDGSFKPNEPVTRAQFAAIISKAFAPSPKRETSSFGDVSRNFWAYQVIQSAYQGGFVSGYPDKTFKPEQQIPRVQALVSLANGLGLSAGSQNVLSVYSDAAQIPNYAAGPIAAATTKQLVVNYPSVKELNPNRQATRAEVAAFVYQALVSRGNLQAIPSPYLVRTP